MSNVKRLPLKNPLSDEARKFRANLNANTLAADLEGGLRLLPRGRHAAGSSWTMKYSARKGLGAGNEPLPITWSLQSTKSNRITARGKIIIKKSLGTATLRAFNTRVVYDTAGKLPVTQRFQMRMDLPTGSVSNTNTATYELK